MKKVLFLMLSLIISGAGIMTAQVNIGNNAKPHAGAILDLSQGGHELGLLLPNAALGDVNVLQVAGDGTKATARGMVIYNTSVTTAGGNGAGLYIWDGARWRVLAIDGGAMTIAPATVPPVSETGGTTGEITVTSPAAEGFSGDYTFVVISGSEYAEVDPASASDGKFEVSFQPNTSALVRKAVVLVTDPGGNTSTFIFTQDANAALCANSGTHDPAVTQTGTLGSGGAVYFSIAAEENVDYIWTRNGVEVATGATYIAIQPGNYVVYGGAVGCTYKHSVTLTVSGTSPDPVVSVISSNGGVLCNSGSVTLTALGIPPDADLAWFKDGVLQPQTTASITITAPGDYFVAIKNGNLYSRPSNISTVVSGGGGSQVSLDPDDVKVNGTPIGSFNSYCKGGSLYLTVDNTQPGYTYTWYNGNDVITATNPYIIPPTQNDILLRLVVTDASGELCPAEANSTEKSITSVAPVPATISGDNQVCSGQSINLSAVDADNAVSYQWYRDEALIPGSSPTLSINAAGSYRVRYSQAGGCTSDLSAPFVVSALGAPVIDWNQFVAEVNSTSSYTFSVRSTGSSLPTAYSWSAVPNGVTISEVNGVATSDLSGISGNTVNLKFSGASGNISLSVAPVNSCGTGSPVTKVVSMIVTTLTAPTVTPVSGTFCGGVNFKIEKPAAWTSQQWSAFSLANITAATLNGSPYAGSLTSDGTYYYYYIAANSTQAHQASISVGGQIGASPVTSATATVTVQQGGTASSFEVGGINCFDINRSNVSGRTKADFNVSYTYRLSGSLGSGASISSVAWTYTNPKNAVQVFTPAASSGTITANQVTVKYNPALLTDASINAGGILVVLTATITTSGGACASAVYKAEIPVRIKDAICCPGVLIAGGVHNAPTPQNIPDNTTYDNLKNYGFSRVTNKDLCVYYRNASNQPWQTAVNNCANANVANIDAVHKDMGGWRLPNVAELGQMHTSGATTATWSPKYNKLSTISSSVPTVNNMTTADTWTISKHSNGHPIYWQFGASGTWETSTTGVSRQVRCVRTMD